MFDRFVQFWGKYKCCYWLLGDCDMHLNWLMGFDLYKDWRNFVRWKSELKMCGNLIIKCNVAGICSHRLCNDIYIGWLKKTKKNILNAICKQSTVYIPYMCIWGFNISCKANGLSKRFMCCVSIAIAVMRCICSLLFITIPLRCVYIYSCIQVVSPKCWHWRWQQHLSIESFVERMLSYYVASKYDAQRICINYLFHLHIHSMKIITVHRHLFS